MILAPNRPELVLPRRKLDKSAHVSTSLGLTYITNQKVACSTVKLALQRAHLGDPSYTPPKSVHHHETSPLLTWPDLTVTREVLAQTFVFSFVRNPFGRLRSAYLNKIVMPQKQGSFRVKAGFGYDEIPPFREFVLAVCAQTPLKQNAHWRLQALNLSVGRITYDFIGRLETFDVDWARLRAATGDVLPAEPETAGRVTRKKKAERLEFDSEMTRAVTTAYADDFDLFGYDPTSP